jgi:16S rRNA (guanine527-N7)-methyltransferase
MNLSVQLATHMSALGYDTTSTDTQVIVKNLLRYLDLIEKWNRVHNLTSIRKPQDMLTHHIMDSLAVLPLLGGQRLADVGSGAGLPGIPIAIAKPNWQVVLIESNRKKAAFLQQVKFELKLKNTNVIVGRAEDFQPIEKFNTVISRALCSIRNFILLAGHLCNESSKESRLVAMKGINPDKEIRQLPTNYFIERVSSICVPGLDAKRHLVVINKKDE